MGRSRHRLSRGLIGILAVILVLGLVSYIHNVGKSIAADKAKGSSPPNGNIAANAVASAQPAVSSAPRTEVTVGPAAPTSPGDAHKTPAVAPPSNRPATQPAGAEKGKSAPNTPQNSGANAASTSHAVVSANPLGDGKTKLDAGDLLGARRILNTALVAGKLSDADASSAKTMLNTINATVVFSPKRFADDEYGGTYSVQPGELLQKIAAQHDITWQYLCRANDLSDPKKLRAGATIKVVKGPFHAIVDKRKFTMEIWVGGEPYSANASYVTSFGVGLGKDDSTPTGKWLIQPGNKIKNPTYYSPRGEGVIQAGDPKNPLGQFWMGLVGIDGHAVGKSSYGIHGTIDPTSIGKQESMGCIRMKNEDVAQVFELLVEGKSTVVVRE